MTDAPGSSVAIEPATWRDMNVLRNLEQVCFPKDAWPLLDLIGILAFPNVVRLKAVKDSQMIGFVAADIRLRERLAWITTIGVLPEYRGQRIGSALLRACEERLETPRIHLCVRASNEAAVRLYRRFGYRRYDLWRQYYSDGEDAIVFEKHLG
ncbi:MAG TPA: GNAT family N-acetyltransferase [Anaerolineales bacterium]|nr:GNAT family N-acetyltransferase [Anaerolineales bacterium]